MTEQPDIPSGESVWQRFKENTITFWRRWKAAIANTLMVVATAVIAVATVVNVDVAKRQWKAMKDAGDQTDQLLRLYRKQLDESDQLLGLYQKQLDETNRLANAAEAANRFASESFQKVQRPLLAVEGIELSEPLVFRSPTDPPGTAILAAKMYVIYKNSGAAEAFNIITEVDIQGPEKKWSEDGWWRIPCENLRKLKRPYPLGAVLAPGFEYRDGKSILSMTIPLEKAKAGGWLLVGCAIYRDQAQHMHHTSFVFQAIPTTDPKNVTFSYVPAYQESD